MSVLPDTEDKLSITKMGEPYFGTHRLGQASTRVTLRPHRKSVFSNSSLSESNPRHFS